MRAAAEPIVVEVERSGFVESIHLVDVAVVDDSGRLVAWAGDPDRVASFRSSAKPIQARAALEAGWQPVDDRHLAVACASHNGEPGHVDVVRSILAASGVPEDELRCPADVPVFVPAALAVSAKQRVIHNCSGKHASMLATCAANGWPFDDYRAPDHPLQMRIADLLKRSGIVDGPLVDGCGVPTFVAPLHTLAAAFGAVDGGPEAAAMRAHPWLVGGTDRLDTDLMTVAPSLLTKAGAEGLACVSGGGFGIALKARDGAGRFRGPALLLVLEQLGLIPEDVLPAHRHLVVLGGGVPVGALRARGDLVRA